MTLSKTSVQPVDLDALERQLREVAVSSLPKRKEDPLSELARIVGREKSLRSIVGGRAEAPQSVPQPVIANDVMPVQRLIESRPAAAPSPQPEYEAMESVEEDWAEASEDGQQPVFEEVHAAAEDESLSYAEDWEDQPAEEGEVADDHEDISRSGSVEPIPGMEALTAEPGAASARRGLFSPRALAFSIPVLLALVGAGAAVVVRGTPIMSKRTGEAPMIKADESPVKVQPAKAGDSGDQTPSQAALDAADPLSKPSQIAVARPEQPVDVVAAVKSAQPRPAAPAQPPASSGIVVVAGPGTLPLSGGAAPAAAPAALMPMAANVPLPDPPQPSQQGSVFGTPRRVSTVTVKPDGTIVSNGKPKTDPMPQPRRLASADPAAPVAAAPIPAAPAPAAAAPPAPAAVAPPAPAAAAPPAPAPVSPAATTPAVRKPADTVRAKPSPAIASNGDSDAKPPRAAPKPVKPKLADTTPAISHAAPADRDSGAPLSITPQGRHGHTVVASATPDVSPRAAAVPSENAARGDSGFSVQLAASPSESDARATLSRLQRQFPSLGGGSVRRADLGSKGIYYRVRVGPLTRDAADRICSQLKAGGAECILTRG